MQIFFAGAETPTWRKHLAQAGVRRVAVNYTHLLPRLPKKKSWDFSSVFPDEVEVLLFATPSSDWSAEEADEFALGYEEFVATHAKRLAYVIELDIANAAARRSNYWSVERRDRFVPLWDGDLDVLDGLTERYANLAVTEHVITEERLSRPRLVQAVKRQGTNLIGLGVNKADLLERIPFAGATSMAWISASRYGETMLWDGHRLRRFPSKQKEEVRRRYRAALQRSGVDVAALMDDDKNATTALALWSWLQLEEAMTTRRRRRSLDTEEVPVEDDAEPNLVASNSQDPADTANVYPLPQTVGIEPLRAVTSGTTVQSRETVPIPFLGFDMVDELVEGEDGEEEATGAQQSIMRLKRGASLRQCDSCVLSDKCPGYKSNHTCAYDIPVEIRTKDQLKATMRAFLEMQGERVLFARLVEETEGGLPDPLVSAEMDRFLAMVGSIKEINEDKEYLKLDLEVKGGAGVLSRIFGSQAGAAARALPNGGYDAGETEVLLGQVLEGREVPSGS